MSRYLVDTNVISDTPPTKAVTRPDLVRWMDAHSAYLFLSAVTVAEIADGIASACPGKVGTGFPIRTCATRGIESASRFNPTGMRSTRRDGAVRKAGDLADWLQTVLHLYGDRVLPFDAATAQIAGALSDLARGRGHAPGFADIAIAATARHHDLTMLSRNTRDFAAMDIAVINPFEGLPAGG